MRPLAGVLLLSFLSLACKREDRAAEKTTAAGPTEAPKAGGETPTARCGGPDRPCTWGEVSDETKRRIQAVADLALETLHDGKTPAQVADALRAESDVSVLSATDEMIRYHVEGGRPAWVWLVSSKRGPTIGTPPPIPLTLSLEGPQGSAAEPPAGKQDPGTKPSKKALILSPFRWHWQLWTKRVKEHGPDEDTRKVVFDDETEKLEAQFSSVPDFEGGVTRKENGLAGNTIQFGMSVADFGSWKDYDVIHVSTHGTACATGATDCEPALATGDLLWISGSDGERAEITAGFNRAGVDVGFIPFGADPNELEMGRKLEPKLRFKDVAKGSDGQTMDGATHYAAGPFMLLTKTWFETHYGAGLADKIIFLSACNSGADAQSLPEALAGPGTAVIGWNKTMRLSTATYGAGLFWAWMLGYPHADIITPRVGGVTVEEAFAKLQGGFAEATFTKGPLKSVVIEGVMSEDEVTGAKLSPSGDRKTRAREIVGLVRGKQGISLQDGDLVEIEGAPGDGKSDALKLTADVIGIGEKEDPGAYVIGVDVDGRTAAETWKPNEKVEPGKWRGEATVDLGFDLQPGKSFALEPWVDLPGGGRSRWRYEDIGVEYFIVTISGPGLSGAQTFAIPPPKAGFSAHGSADQGGFVLSFRDNDARNAVSADGSVLDWMSGGTRGPDCGKAGEHPLGPAEGGRNGWDLYVWLQAESCPPRFEGCQGVGLSTDEGTMKITRFLFGKGRARPHLRGPTLVQGTFEVAAHGNTPGPYENKTYTIEGAFSMVE